jgi:hypothetical protein
MTDLVLKEEDEDFIELINYCVELKATTTELTQTFCKYILKQCGGHTYPTLAFIEYFFTRDDAKEFLASQEVFHRYFCSADFARSPFYEAVRHRCFGHLRYEDTQEVAIRVMGGKEEVGDIATMTRLGWWDPEARSFISLFLENAHLSGINPRTDGVRYLSENMNFENNTELVIIEGLSGMDDSDFKCWKHESGVKVVNGVSFNWACKVRAKIPNVYLSYQERVAPGLVDVYLNSFADTSIEFMLDATQTVNEESEKKSQDIDGHLQRFRDGKYAWKRFVLFNFAMSNDKVVLPRDLTAHDKVYTYVRATNTLYRGNKPIKFSAIPKLSGGSRPFEDGKLTIGAAKGSSKTTITIKKKEERKKSTKNNGGNKK